MGKRITFNVPTTGGIKAATGELFHVTLSGKRIAVVLQDVPGGVTPHLTHYASGQVIVRSETIAAACVRMRQKSNYRHEAKTLFDRVRALHGDERILAVMEGAKVINAYPPREV